MTGSIIFANGMDITLATVPLHLLKARGVGSPSPGQRKSILPARAVVVPPRSARIANGRIIPMTNVGAYIPSSNGKEKVKERRGK